MTLFALEDRIRETQERFAARDMMRSENEALVSEGLILEADSAERVNKRLARLDMDPATAKAMVEIGPAIAAAAIRPGTVAAHDPVALERVLGANNLAPVSFLYRGAAVAESVGRISVHLADGRRGFGTGSLVGPRLLLTNNHVLGSIEDTRRSFVELNYEVLGSGVLDAVVRFDFDADALFVTDRHLDYTLVALRPRPDMSLDVFGWIPLIGQEGKIIVGEKMNIIQHPNGELKQLALRENLLVDVLPDFLHYKTDTAPGSSGSPVFNDQWEMVALHHSGVPTRDAQGQILALDGSVWEPWMGDHRIDWIANEGARVSRVVGHIESRNLTGVAADLRAAMFEATPPVTEAGARVPARAGGPGYRGAGGAAAGAAGTTGPRVGADGTVEWEIPLRVSVSLGSLAPWVTAGQPPARGADDRPPRPPAEDRHTPAPKRQENVIVSMRMMESMLQQPEAKEFRAQLDEAVSDEAFMDELGVAAELDTDIATLAAFRKKWDKAFDELRDAAAKVDDEVMFAAQNPIASAMQSKLAEQVAERGKVTPARAGGAEALELQFSRGDWWGWFKSVFTFVDKSEFHPILRPDSTVPRPIPERYRIALFSDWGTNLYGAPGIAQHIRNNGHFDLVMHLGDVYYSGTETEMRQRLLDAWPFLGPATVNRGLNSNHDMYSGGHAYFGMVLPRFSQPFSYFAMQNSRWLLVCLDSAYVDFDLDDQQVDWIEAVVGGAGNRKVVFFSHHQLFSRLDSQGTKLAEKLKPLLDAGDIDFWYWGHEHRCVLYDPHGDFGLQGRCVGHGGIPEKRDNVEDGALVEETAPYAWRQLTAKKGVPRSIALDGPNPAIGDVGHKYLPHGYVVIELDGDALIETYFVSDGTRVLEKRH